MSESVNERTTKHSLHDHDIPLNICIDALSVEDIGIIVGQRATVTEYPEALLTRARGVWTKYLNNVKDSTPSSQSVAMKRLFLLPLVMFSPLGGADNGSINGKLKAKTVIFLFQKILDNLERNDWSKFTIERFQPRLNSETKRGKVFFYNHQNCFIA